MIEYLKDNTWIISVAALIISLASFTIVVIDKLKVWKESSETKKLKKDKAILIPIVGLDVKDYHTITVEKNGHNTTRALSPHFSKLYYVFQSIDHNKVSNSEIAKKLEHIKTLEAGQLFEPKAAPTSDQYTVKFTDEVNEIIVMTRSYLATVL